MRLPVQVRHFPLFELKGKPSHRDCQTSIANVDFSCLHQALERIGQVAFLELDATQFLIDARERSAALAALRHVSEEE